MELRAAILVRISDDRLGDEKGVARQEADCRLLADKQGWQVAGVYTENDTSAYRRRVVLLPDGTTAMRVLRPEYRRLLEDLTAGTVNALVAYDLDRVARDPRDLEDLIDVVEARRIPTASVTGSLDLSTDAGVFMARMMVNVANKSSRDTARRVRRKLEDNAEQGKHHGGSRPYGWQEDRVTLDPAEAAVVRTAADMLLAGHSVKAIVRALNSAGHLNSVGKPWRHVTVRSMLTRPRNAGHRQHHGRIVGPGRWEPILPVDVWEQVRMLLTDPARRTTPGAAGRTHLLSGIAVCGVCGSLVRVGKGKPYNGVAADIYRCPSNCVSRDRNTVDRYVQTVVCERLTRPDAATLLARDEPDSGQHRAEAERLRGRLAVAAAHYSDGLITDEQMLTINSRLRPQLAAAEQAIPPARSTALDGVVGPDAERRWYALDTSVRRTVLADLVTVRIIPTRRGPGFDPDSVKVGWR